MRKPVKEVLSKNLTAAMEARGVSNRQLAQAVGISDSTVSRIKRGIHAAGIDVLDSIAKYLDYSPWQMLCEEFDPKNPPALKRLSEREAAFYKALEDLRKHGA